MEIYKDLTTPASKEFEQLLNNQLSKTKIEEGADFADMAKKHSECPYGNEGGNMGEFSPGQMVPEFDTVVFNDDVGKVHGPVKTQFGYHLIEITSRS